MLTFAFMAVILFLESLGGGELLIILLFVLIFFGSDKIPSLARGLGKGMRELRDAMQGVQSEIRQTINETEDVIKKNVEDVKKEIDQNDLTDKP